MVVPVGAAGGVHGFGDIVGSGDETAAKHEIVRLFVANVHPVIPISRQEDPLEIGPVHEPALVPVGGVGCAHGFAVSVGRAEFEPAKQLMVNEPVLRVYPLNCVSKQLPLLERGAVQLPAEVPVGTLG